MSDICTRCFLTMTKVFFQRCRHGKRQARKMWSVQHKLTLLKRIFCQNSDLDLADASNRLPSLHLRSLKATLVPRDSKLCRGCQTELAGNDDKENEKWRPFLRHLARRQQLKSFLLVRNLLYMLKQHLK